MTLKLAVQPLMTKICKEACTLPSGSGLFPHLISGHLLAVSRGVDRVFIHVEPASRYSSPASRRE